MKKLLYTLAAVLVCTGAAAQNPTLYFMEGVPLRSQMNPALAPQRGYFNIPVLGGLAVTAGGNTSLDHLLFRRDGRLVTLLSPSVSSADALSDLHSKNLVNADIRVNLLGFGAYTANRKHFWSFDLNLRTSVSTQFPYELFHFFKTGESAQVRNLGLSSDAYAEAGFNYSFPIGEKFYVGARVKFLVGLARAKSYFTQFNVSLGENEWYAEAVGELEVNSNLLTIPTRQEAGQDGVYRNYYQLDDMEFDAKFKPAGYGAAFDIGATYEPIPNLLVSAAVNDIGFIAWNKASSMHGTVSRRLTFDGAQVDASGVADIDFDLGELKFEQVDEESATRMLHYTMNLGAEYRLWDRRVGFGALYQIHKYDYAALHNLTASVNFQPVRWFGLSGSYSVHRQSGQRAGVGTEPQSGLDQFLCRYRRVADQEERAVDSHQAGADELQSGHRCPDGETRAAPARLHSGECGVLSVAGAAHGAAGASYQGAAAPRAGVGDLRADRRGYRAQREGDPQSRTQGGEGRTEGA